ncbi:hypothetical protein [Psychrobacillus sp. NPDC096623]|uniref:hypothetical protein n=1 Tax=Psychrobacillus sp. NPDC096623 TaxID=3364492 RepID=UPI00382CB096
MSAKKYVLSHFDDFFVVLFEKDNKANKLVILKDKFTVHAKEGDLLEVEINPDKSGYNFKMLEEEGDSTKQRLLDLIENMKKS